MNDVSINHSRLVTMRSAMLILIGCLSISMTNGTVFRAYKFTGGHWFYGTSFHETIFYSVNGILTQTAPEKVHETYDLRGGYIIPALGDAHCHHFASSFGLDPLSTRTSGKGFFMQRY